MLELTPENTADYLCERGWLTNSQTARVVPLAWGVSNVVLRVSPGDVAGERRDFVVKQSRGRLRTAAPWFSRLDRIFREIDVLKVLGTLLPSGIVPGVIFEDRENYLFGMEAAPADHIVWKQELLTGKTNVEVARRLGYLLATVHCGTANREDLRTQFRDTEVFYQLRVHPFYETLIKKFAEAREPLTQLVRASLQSADCLVLADFSPKNVLLTGSPPASSANVMLVDFETGHYGDPAFDLGFFLSHLLLKAVKHHREHWDAFAELTRQFLNTYWSHMHAGMPGERFEQVQLQQRMWGHLAGCLWARIDGTSPVDYLTEPEFAPLIRSFSLSVFKSPPGDWDELLQRLANALSSQA